MGSWRIFRKLIGRRIHRSNDADVEGKKRFAVCKYILGSLTMTWSDSLHDSHASNSLFPLPHAACAASNPTPALPSPDNLSIQILGILFPAQLFVYPTPGGPSSVLAFNPSLSVFRFPASRFTPSPPSPPPHPPLLHNWCNRHCWMTLRLTHNRLQNDVHSALSIINGYNFFNHMCTSFMIEWT